MIDHADEDDKRISFPNMEGESKDDHLPLQQETMVGEQSGSPSDQMREAARGTVSQHDQNLLSMNGNLPTNPSNSSQTASVMAQQLQVAQLNPAHPQFFMVPGAGPFQSPPIANPYVMALQNAIQNLAMASAVGTHQQALQNQGNIQQNIITPSIHQAASTFLASVMNPGAGTGTIPALQQAMHPAPAQVVVNDGRLQLQQHQQQQREQAAIATFIGQQPNAQPSSSGILPPSAMPSSDLQVEGLTNRSAVPLYLDYDEQALSEYQCVLRKQIELFETRPEDIQGNAQGRNTPIYIGQVGIRCRHCSVLPKAVRPMGTVYYSRTLSGVYQVSQNMAKVHFFGNKCTQMPDATKEQLLALQRTNKRASGGKEYWVDGLKVHGVYEDGKALRFRTLENGSRGF
jgi:3-dehydroquinate dehydratase